MVLLRVGELIVNAYEAMKIVWNYINGHSPASCGYSENNLILYFRITTFLNKGSIKKTVVTDAV